MFLSIRNAPDSFRYDQFETFSQPLDFSSRFDYPINNTIFPAGRNALTRRRDRTEVTMSNSNSGRTELNHILIPLLTVIILTAIDQITKCLAVSHLKGQPNLVIIPGVFELEYLENRGAAFGSFQGMQIPLIVFTLVLLGVIIWKYFQIPSRKRFVPLRVTFTVLTSGAIGNLIDRVVNNYVVDFFYFTPIDFPRFNVADCYVVVSVIALGILLLFVYKEEELTFLFQLKKSKEL